MRGIPEPSILGSETRGPASILRMPSEEGGERTQVEQKCGGQRGGRCWHPAASGREKGPSTPSDRLGALSSLCPSYQTGQAASLPGLLGAS